MQASEPCERKIEKKKTRKSGNTKKNNPTLTVVNEFLTPKSG